MVLVQDRLSLTAVLNDAWPQPYELMGFRRNPIPAVSAAAAQAAAAEATPRDDFGAASCSLGFSGGRGGCNLHQLVYECWDMRRRTAQPYVHIYRFPTTTATSAARAAKPLASSNGPTTGNCDHGAVDRATSLQLWIWLGKVACGRT